MATSQNTRETGNDNRIPQSPAQAAWSAALSAYEPVRCQWEEEYERAEAMPDSHEKDGAFDQFYKVHLPDYHKARDELMRIPAPTIMALAKKMEIGDGTDEKHYDLCLDDVRRLAAEAAAS